MLKALLGTKNQKPTLQYVLCFDSGYAQQVTKYGTSLPSTQNQLNNFEDGGVMVSKMQGRTKVFSFNPRYAFLDEFFVLLNKTKEYYKPGLKTKFEMQKLRPKMCW